MHKKIITNSILIVVILIFGYSNYKTTVCQIRVNQPANIEYEVSYKENNYYKNPIDTSIYLETLTDKVILKNHEGLFTQVDIVLTIEDKDTKKTIYKSTESEKLRGNLYEWNYEVYNEKAKEIISNLNLTGITSQVELRLKNEGKEEMLRIPLATPKYVITKTGAEEEETTCKTTYQVKVIAFTGIGIAYLVFQIHIERKELQKNSKK